LLQITTIFLSDYHIGLTHTRLNCDRDLEAKIEAAGSPSGTQENLLGIHENSWFGGGKGLQTEVW
jgi:hypothetical protein